MKKLITFTVLSALSFSCSGLKPKEVSPVEKPHYASVEEYLQKNKEQCLEATDQWRWEKIELTAQDSEWVDQKIAGQKVAEKSGAKKSKAPAQQVTTQFAKVVCARRLREGFQVLKVSSIPKLKKPFDREKDDAIEFVSAQNEMVLFDENLNVISLKPPKQSVVTDEYAQYYDFTGLKAVPLYLVFLSPNVKKDEAFHSTEIVMSTTNYSASMAGLGMIGVMVGQSIDNANVRKVKANFYPAPETKFKAEWVAEDGNQYKHAI